MLGSDVKPAAILVMFIDFFMFINCLDVGTDFRNRHLIGVTSIETVVPKINVIIKI